MLFLCQVPPDPCSEMLHHHTAPYQPQTSQCKFFKWDCQYFYWYICPVSLVDYGIIALTATNIVMIIWWTLAILGIWKMGQCSAQESQWNTLIGQHNCLPHQYPPVYLLYIHQKQDTNTTMAHINETGHIQRCRWCLIRWVLLVDSSNDGYYLVRPYVNVSCNDRQRTYLTTEE